MRARILPASQTATQSGLAIAGEWILDFQPPPRQVNDPLLGWWGSGGTQGQVRLEFDTCRASRRLRPERGHRIPVEQPPAKRADQAQGLRRQLPLRPGENWTH